MTRSEQHKMIQTLKDYQSKMGRDDVDEFEMFLKRDKDDEDLDTLSRRKLEELYERYVPKRSKVDIEALWKKYSSRREGSEDTD